MKTNWLVKKLGEVAIINPPKSEVSNIAVGTAVSFVSMASISPQSGTITNIESRNIEDVRKGYTYFANNDVLFAKITPCMENGKVAIAHNLQNGIGFGTTEVHVLRPTSQVLPEWIYSVVSNEQFRSDAKRHMTGTAGQQRVPKEYLENFKIPVPPKGEQKKIIGKLEKILAKIEESHTQRQESIEEAKNVIKIKLGELFENNSWDEMRVSDIAEKPQYGYTAPSAKDKIGPRLLRITDIQNGMVDWENVPYCKCNEVDKYRLTSGDIVFARTGATTGKSFLIKDTPEQTVFASYLIRLRTKGGIKQEFLYWFFQSPQYWDQIMSHQRGSAQPNVNAVTLSTIKLRMPENLKEQDKIVEYLDGLSEKVQALQRLQQEQLQELEALQQSVLHQAFQGELAR